MDSVSGVSRIRNMIFSFSNLMIDFKHLRFLLAVLLCAASIGTSADARAESVIAFWDFNDGFDVPDESVQIIHNASIGAGTLYQQRADTDGNGKGGNAFTDMLLGINAADGRSMAWDDVAKSGANDAEFFLEVSTTGFTNIQVSLDIRGNGDVDDEIQSYDLKFDTNALVDVTNPGAVVGTIRDFENGTSTDVFNNQPLVLNGTTFVRETIDLSGFTELNNQNVIAIRLDDFDGNGDLRLDNVLVTGISAVPEPSSVAMLGMLGCVCASGMRRRRI